MLSRRRSNSLRKVISCLTNASFKKRGHFLLLNHSLYFSS
jgi:hypothetical protein